MRYIAFFIAGLLGGLVYAMIENYFDQKSRARQHKREMIKDDPETDDRLSF